MRKSLKNIETGLHQLSKPTEVGQIIQLGNIANIGRVRRVAHIKTEQRETNLDLFPLDVTRVDPPRSGADSLANVIAVDGLQYTVKSANHRTELPVSEWICYHLAEACGIAVPTAKILRMPSGELVFGSRWAGGVYTQTGNTNTPDQLLERLFAPSRLWALYAFDIFVQNFDRRIANLIFQSVDTKTNVLAIDFSRALLFHPMPFNHPSALPIDCATRKLARFVSRVHSVSHEECDRVLSKLDQINVNHLSTWLKHAPTEWQSHSKLNELLTWWGSQQKRERIEAIKEGIWNGSLI